MPSSAFGAKRMLGLLLLALVVAGFVAAMAVRVPIHSAQLAGAQRFTHLRAALDAIAIVLVIDVIAVVAMLRRRRREPSA